MTISTEQKKVMDRITLLAEQLRAEFATIERRHNKAAARRARKLSLELDALHKQFRKLSMSM
jgi:hypothetical protein